MRVYYIDSDDSIHQIVFDQQEWHPDTNATQNVRVYPGFSLAASMDSEIDVAFSVYCTDSKGALGHFGWANSTSTGDRSMLSLEARVQTAEPLS